MLEYKLLPYKAVIRTCASARLICILYGRVNDVACRMRCTRVVDIARLSDYYASLAVMYLPLTKEYCSGYLLSLYVACSLKSMQF